MSDYFCVLCGQYHSSITACPTAYLDSKEPIVIGRADFGTGEKIAALERELAEVKAERDELAGYEEDAISLAEESESELAEKTDEWSRWKERAEKAEISRASLSCSLETEIQRRIKNVAAFERELEAFKANCTKVHEADNTRNIALEQELADTRIQLNDCSTALGECRTELAGTRAKMARLRVDVEVLEDYTCHRLNCPLSQWHEGRPTKDGGYETRYGDKWYQGNDKPACSCGLDAALATVKRKEETDGI